MPLNRCFPCFKFRQNEIIDRLDYSNTPLTDAFPEVWQHERTLEELQLTSTRLTTLPPQLFYCQGLRVLMVNSNNLETIPNAVASLRQLQHLDISRNLIANVPEEIKACKNLTHLDLSCNSLQRLPDAITCLISLQELLLNETYLEFLPANFGRLVNLRILELRLNNLITLPKSMARLTNLQRIDIGGNEFTELPEVIGELKSLRELWIDFNQIRRIAANIGKLRELQHFEANGNLLVALPNELSQWRNIEVLSVCTNSLEALPFSVGMLKSLVTLKCEANTLCELPDSISSLENLEELVLSHNKLLRLPTTIGMLRKLRYLFLDDNKLRMLPDEICSCSNLSLLSVANNQISAMPQNTGHLVHLRVLNLVNNYINALPVSMLSLINLTSLWLSDNQSQPLMPLQYLDANTKTQLTCFMLPQVTFKLNSMQMEQQQHQQHQQAEYEFVYAKRALPPHQQQQQQHVPISPTRRICFAEEATILSGSNTIATAAAVMPAAIKHVSYGTAPVANHVNYAHAVTQELHETLSGGGGGGGSASSVRLMRSPTPYPKELRQMAKYVRSSSAAGVQDRSPQRDDNGDSIHAAAVVVVAGTNAAAANAGEVNSNVRKARVVPNGDLCDNSYTDNQAHVTGAGVAPLTSTQAPANSVMYDPSNNYDYATYQQQQQDNLGQAMHYNALPQQYVQQLPLVNYVDHYQQQQQQQQQLYIEAQQLPTTHLNGHHAVIGEDVNDMDALALQEAAYEMQVLQQQQQQQQLEHEQQQRQRQLQQQQELLLTPRMEPPPYHIARVFTKKTPEDLTHYETMRHRNQQQQQQQEQQQYYNNSPYANAVANYESESDAINSNFKTTAINNRHECDPETEIDYQNNVSEASMQQNSEEQATHTLNDSLSQLSLASGNSSMTATTTNQVPQPTQQLHSNSNHTLQRSSSTPTPTLMGSGKKWIFGVHKNPTVKQVTLKRDGSIGFNIAEAQTQAGVYVSDLSPNTSAARLLHINDKLLEIDGYDVTNMSLSDVRRLLQSCGGVINIMLSRK